MIGRALAASLVLSLVLSLGACGTGTTDPSGATPSEARQLNDAAAMLDANSVDANAVSPDNQDSQ